MKGIKCSQCGLVYWSTDENCRRCGQPTAVDAAPGYDEPPYESHSQYSTPAPVVNYADDAEKAALLKTLRGASIYFYVIGGLQILLWFALGQLMILDGIVNITLSFVMYKFRSRVAALLLLGLTLLAVLATIVAFASGERTALISPIGVIIRIVVGVRMVKAAFNLQQYPKESAPQMLPPPPPNFYPEAAPQYAE
jgi:hypothetical protein